MLHQKGYNNEISLKLKFVVICLGCQHFEASVGSALQMQM